MRKTMVFTKEYRRLTALILSFVLVFSLILVPCRVNAEEIDDVIDEQDASDILDVQSVEVSTFAVLKGKFGQHKSESNDEGSTVEVTDRNWQSYRATYVYDQMNAVEKAFYKELEDVCMDYVKNSDKDAIYLKDKNGNGAYYLPAVSIADFDNKEYVKVLQTFIYSNPQYYFTTSSFATNGDNLYLLCFPAFADGDDRAVVTNKLFATLDVWADAISKNSTSKEEIEKVAHDLLCTVVSYDNDSASGVDSGNYDSDVFYSQTIYSTVFKHKSVCAGYSLTFELLLNSLGVPTLTAFSDCHAWNKVNLGDDDWYAVDVTWDDIDYPAKITYDFYNKSDEAIKAYDIDSSVHEVKYPEYYPSALKNYGEENNGSDVNVDNEPTTEDSEKTENVTPKENESIDTTVNISDENSEVQPSTEVGAEEEDDDVLDVSDDVEIISDVANTSKEHEVAAQDSESDKDVSHSDNNDNASAISNDASNTIYVESVNNNSSDNIVGGIGSTDVALADESTTVTETADNDNQVVVGKSDPSKIVKVTTGKNKVKVSWKKVKNISGYEICLSTDKKFKKIAKKVNVSKSKKNIWVKKLKKKTYYVRIRTYKDVDGTRVTSAWSGIKKVTLK